MNEFPVRLIVWPLIALAFLALLLWDRHQAARAHADERFRRRIKGAS